MSRPEKYSLDLQRMEKSFVSYGHFCAYPWINLVDPPVNIPPETIFTTQD